jgi:hypothetical protein
VVASGTFAQGIDLKGEGGFVVGPGSLHRRGRRYEWEVMSHPDDVPLAELPAWIVNQARRTYSVAGHKRGDGKPLTPAAKSDFAAMWAEFGLSLVAGDTHYLCPFHADHDPSLHIDADRALWHCFGCGQGGGVVDLRLRMSQQSFVTRSKTTGCRDIAWSLPFPDPEFWPDPSPSAGRCGLPQAHRKRQSPTEHRALAVLCGSWDCNTCGPYLKQEWVAHLSYLLHGASDLHILVAAEGGWESTHKQIGRMPEGQSDYVAFNLSDLSYLPSGLDRLVITTAPTGRSVDTRTAIHVIREVIRALPFDHLRIATSSSWERARHKVEKTGKWELAGWIGTPIDDAMERARRLGLDPRARRVFKDNRGKPRANVFDFTTPAVTSNAYLWIMATMAAGPSVPIED